MISVLLYGRNDAHGYNLHRRAALSLNCLAEVLTRADDEIVFVDYNTPDELPTFVEALADTLTERCLELMRVIRVPASLHEQRFAGRTHLAVVEPVARNVAARRANAANRWLLSTNTDMIFLPHREESVSEISADLADGFYGVPRFELPEWLWEQLPRSDPRRAMAEIARFGPRMRLDEPTISHEWVRFDAPGDFQLILRGDFAAVDGFDEEMLLGWHVDSNLSRRMALRRGSIMSLDDRVAGYHCNHNRIPTVYHGVEALANDLGRFFYSIERADLPGQRLSWGLADVSLEEIPVARRVGTETAATVADVIPDDPGPRVPSDAVEAGFALSYDSGHVLPFVADSLVVSSSAVTVGYIGVNRVLVEMLASLVERLGQGSLTVADLEDRGSVEALVGSAEVIVVDLGVDTSLVEPPNAMSVHPPPSFPIGLDRVFGALERLIELERARLERGEHARRLVLINSSAALWDAYVLAHLICSHTTMHSRVRRATVRRLSSDDPRAQEALLRQRRLVRWAARGHGRLGLRAGRAVELSELEDFRGFGRGWAAPDETGIWTQGSRSELAIALKASQEGDHILLVSLASVCVGSEETLSVDLLVNGERLGRRDFGQHDLSWPIELPETVVTEREADLTFLIADPRSPHALGWSADERPLGIFVRGLSLERVDRSVAPGEKIVFSDRSGAQRLLAEGWSAPEPTGVWSVGERASLILKLRAARDTDYELLLAVNAFVTPSHPELAVEVWSIDEKLANRIFRYGSVVDGFFRVPLPATARDEGGMAALQFRLSAPARPVDEDINADTRPLGIHLRSLIVSKSGWQTSLRYAISHGAQLGRSLLGIARRFARRTQTSPQTTRRQ